MDEFQLEEFCRRNPDCGCDCMHCPAFIRHMRYEMGWDECDEDYADDEEEDWDDLD